MKYFKDNFVKRELHGDSIVAGFFYSHREGERQASHSSMLRSVLYDILHQEESFFPYFQSEFRRYVQTYSSGEWPYKSLKKVLTALGDHPRDDRLTLILDAVDESKYEDRRNILQLLFDLCSKKGALIVKVFIASRPVVELEHHIKHSHNFIRLQEETEPDISNFTRATLQDPGLDLSGDLLLRATNHIIEHAQGVFLWVHLIGQELLIYAATGCSKKEILDLLISLPTELEDLYERILERLKQGKARDIRDGERMFQLVLFAYRPLTVPELRHALAIPGDLDTEFNPSDESFEEAIISGIEKRIMHCGGNILEIKNSEGIFVPLKSSKFLLTN